MADVTLTYKGNTIAEMSDTGTKTLKTAGKYCEGDIGVSYIKPESGGTSDELVKQLIQTRIGSLTIPSGITKIGSYAFYQSGFTPITLSEGVTEIGQYAFSESSMTRVYFPQSLITIKQYAFKRCQMLNPIIFPQNLETIESGAFYDCMILKNITFKGTPTSIASDAFADCGYVTFNVPWAEGAVAGAPWGAKNATINYNYTE